MRNRLPLVHLLALGTVAVATSACGNFSQEDLLFRAALPSKEAFALRPPGAVDDAAAGPGTARQTLDRCAEGADELRCHAQNFAGGFNALTFALLDIVDNIVANEPSRRAPGKRVWGPHFVQDKGFTARFEMVRHDDGATFSYCLHVKPGGSLPGADDDVDCDVQTSARGFVRFLSGTFIAGVDDDHLAKSGQGTMLLEARNLPEGDDAFFNALDSIEFSYDSTNGTDVALTIHFEDASIPPAASHFVRASDGSGTFQFEVDMNIGDTATPAAEHVEIRAEWNADLAGRAEAVVTHGDVPAGEQFHVVECWDTTLERVYFLQTFAEDEQTTGDPQLCVIDALRFDE